MRRAMAVLGILAGVSLIAVLVTRAPSDGPSVQGTKVTRCSTQGAAARVASGTHHLTADNAPLTVTVSGGRITAVLSPAVRISPGASPSPRVASFLIGTPRASGGTITADVTVRNLTDCPARVGAGRAVALHGNDPSRASGIRFGTADRVVVAPGQQVAGRFSIPLAGDGRYEITATTDSEIGLVR